MLADVLLPSTYFCDLVFTGLPAIPQLGDEVFSQHFTITPGGGFIPAVALSRLGVRVKWACDFGNDFFSRFVLEEARNQKLDETLFRIHDQPLRVITVAYSFAHERAFLSYRDPFPPVELPQLIRAHPARVLMLMSLRYGELFPAVIQAGREVGMQVFMDCQALQGASLDDPRVVSSLQAVDVFAPNREEALQLTRQRNIETALERLAALTPTVVIKLGNQGALACRSGRIIHVPAIPVEAVDTTGAGDNFDCGFVYGMLHGYSLEDCLHCGNYCGSRSTTASGGWESAPTAEQVEQWLHETRR